ncbi:uncharacterized protein LOC116266928 [Nymphaea colorata]|nr:uncharacterized protein LOC116266928 [Nymphaea colorata]
MAKLKTDSPLCRRIVLSFLDFLNSVEPAPGVDIEGFEVVRDCLEDIFGLDALAVDGPPNPNLLVDYFNSLERKKQEIDFQNVVMTSDAATTSSSQNTSAVKHMDAGASQSEGSPSDAKNADNGRGVSKDELFDHFLGELRRIHYLGGTPHGDDHDQIVKAKEAFDDAMKEMENSSCQKLNPKNLAEALKSLGNHAMRSKLYSDAIDLYTFAIALCEDNAVYYCNRAAAYTQIQKYLEAIDDCEKSIYIDPNYSKAYSRLGLAHYAQGNYNDAISQGFLKALQLDPTSSSIQDNIRVAEQKLKEELERNASNQNDAVHGNQESSSQSSSSRRPTAPFTSVPFDASLPSDFANIFMNMATNAFQGQHTDDRSNEAGNPDGTGNPEIRIGGNISLNFEGPEQVAGSLRSLMEMLSAANQTRGDSAQQTSERN